VKGDVRKWLTRGSGKATGTSTMEGGVLLKEVETTKFNQTQKGGADKAIKGKRKKNPKPK